MPWAPFPGIQGGGFKLLRVHPDTGGYTALLWIPPGTRGPLHKHTAAVEYLILQGHVDFGDRVLGPGSYFYEPAGLTHSEPPPDEDVVMLVTSFGPIATTGPTVRRARSSTPTCSPGSTTVRCRRRGARRAEPTIGGMSERPHRMYRA